MTTSPAVVLLERLDLLARGAMLALTELPDEETDVASARRGLIDIRTLLSRARTRPDLELPVLRPLPGEPSRRRLLELLAHVEGLSDTDARDLIRAAEPNAAYRRLLELLGEVEGLGAEEALATVVAAYSGEPMPHAYEPRDCGGACLHCGCGKHDNPAHQAATVIDEVAPMPADVDLSDETARGDVLIFEPAASDVVAQRGPGTPCGKCAGCGQIANDDDGTPWKYWAELPPPSNLAVTLGLVRPQTCPACNGTGTTPAVTA